MNPTRHPSNTRVFGAPVGWDQAGTPVEPLGITDVVLHGDLPALLSFWQPTEEDQANIANGGLVGLYIIDSRMAPVSLVTLPPGQAAADHDPAPKSPTHGMTLGERIAHVGGRTNAQGYVEFGSPMAVNALIKHFIRDFKGTAFANAHGNAEDLWTAQSSDLDCPTCGGSGHKDDAGDVLSTGIEAAAGWVDKRREAFNADRGSVDPDTGALEYGTGPHAEAAREYSAELEEIAEGIRALLTRNEVKR